MTFSSWLQILIIFLLCIIVLTIICQLRMFYDAIQPITYLFIFILHIYNQMHFVTHFIVLHYVDPLTELRKALFRKPNALVFPTFYFKYACNLQVNWIGSPQIDDSLSDEVPGPCEWYCSVAGFVWICSSRCRRLVTPLSVVILLLSYSVCLRIKCAYQPFADTPPPAWSYRETPV